MSAVQAYTYRSICTYQRISCSQHLENPTAYGLDPPKVSFIIGPLN